MSSIPDHPDPFRRLVDIMDRLRGPGGCPWDREQTHESLKPYVVEEAHEVCDAIDQGDDDELRVELGDLALQIVFHARLAKESGRFTVDDVYESICEKLIRRHPHVFGDVEAATPAEVLKNWETIKQEEKRGNAKEKQVSALDGVPRTLPALQRAQRIQEKAANLGFDWERAADAFPKVQEELDETRRAMETGESSALQEELGDLLFSLVNFIRLSGFQAEELAQAASNKFLSRFRDMETLVHAKGGRIQEMSLEELDSLWNTVKNHKQS